MDSLELVVVVGVAIVVCRVAGRRLRLPWPVLLLLAGVLLGFAPALAGARLPPQLMLLVFLPVLLFWDSLTGSLREMRANLTGVVLAATVLVLLTAAAVATTVHAAGLAWGPAWVLGAALAPTDATAVGALARALPRRNVAVLQAESLVNDGTALVVYGVAVGVTVGGETLRGPHLVWLVLSSYGGGILAGGLVAWLAAQVRRRVSEPRASDTVVLLIPFCAYLLAELVHASGVLAVVVCGLVTSRVGPRIGRAATRVSTTAFLSLGTFLLNAALFVLVGLEAHAAVRDLTGRRLLAASLAAAAVCVVLLAVRFAFFTVVAYTIRLVDRRPTQLMWRISNADRFVAALAGFRGAVSLAVALSVPTTLRSGAPFPDRDLIVFVTATVVATTLVVQGLLLPRVARRMHVTGDEDTTREDRLAERVALEEALAALPQAAAELGTGTAVAGRLRAEYEAAVRLLHDREDDVRSSSVARSEEEYTALRLALLGHQRAAVIRLRDERQIDDTLLRQLQGRFDLEELGLTRADPSPD